MRTPTVASEIVHLFADVLITNKIVIFSNLFNGLVFNKQTVFDGVHKFYFDLVVQDKG